MICLTIDVHHMSLHTPDQARLKGSTEAAIAAEFIRMARDRGIKLTCFLTGRLVQEEPVEMYGNFNNIEIGGHTYNAFEPQLFHRISKKLLGTYCGPRWYQERDIRDTVEIIRERLKIGIESWRDHAYFNDRHTRPILHKYGIKILSDNVSRDQALPEPDEFGIYNFPINILPDHEHLFHSDRDQSSVGRWVKRYKWSDAFGSESYYADKWYGIVEDQVKRREAAGEISVMLVHPICLYLCDEYKTISKLLDFVKGYETILLKSSIRYAKGT